MLSFWLKRAFDRYVKDDANLDTELAGAALFTTDYQNCTSVIPAFDANSDDLQSYFQQFMGTVRCRSIPRHGTSFPRA